MGGPVPDFPKFELLRTLIWLVAAGSFVVVWVLKGRFLSPEAIRRRGASVGEYLNTWHIILFALAEMLTIYGVLLFLMTALQKDFMVLAGLSLLLLLWLRPKADDYR